MNRELYFESSPDLLRASVVEDGRLCEIHSEQVGSVKSTESLFFGRIVQIRPSVCAAFVDIGLEQNGFLPLDDVKDRQLRCGELLIVQGAAKQAVDSKGLRLTTKLNLAGKWLVLVPGGSGVHISKKVKDNELRSVLLETVSGICPEGCGLIVRTASQEVTRGLLEDEAALLYTQWQSIQRKAAGLTKPGVLKERLTLDERLARDLGDPQLRRVVTNSPEIANRFEHMKTQSLLAQQTRIELFEEKTQLLFDAFQLEDKISRALNRRVWLDCGGYLVIEACEAMTVIDVNSGKMTLGRDLEDTALRVNMEAAHEIARQIRLRDVGGMIVVDFIDMKSAENQDQLVKTLRGAVKNDRAQVQILGLTKLGLMEMTRKRVHAELRKELRVTCGSCGGDGEVLSPREIARRALMQMRRKALSGQRGPFVISIARKAARELAEMYAPAGCDVYALACEKCRALDFSIEQIEEAAEVPKGAVQLKKG